MQLIAGEEGTVNATCPNGSNLVSGGFLMSRPVHIVLNSRGTTPETWVVTAKNTFSESATITAVAECAP
ncbi:hypothetical protein ACIRS3_00225 [Streptomyces virginiae]